MALRTPRSLHLRLWIVIALASLPVFLMAFLDYLDILSGLTPGDSYR